MRTYARRTHTHTCKEKKLKPCKKNVKVDYENVFEGKNPQISTISAWVRYRYQNRVKARKTAENGLKRVKGI